MMGFQGVARTLVRKLSRIDERAGVEIVPRVCRLEQVFGLRDLGSRVSGSGFQISGFWVEGFQGRKLPTKPCSGTSSPFQDVGCRI